jgi:hypothetical protein
MCQLYRQVSENVENYSYHRREEGEKTCQEPVLDKTICGMEKYTLYALFY